MGWEKLNFMVVLLDDFDVIFEDDYFVAIKVVLVLGRNASAEKKNRALFRQVQLGQSKVENCGYFVTASERGGDLPCYFG